MDYAKMRQRLKARAPTAAPRDWYEIRNLHDDVTVVRIYDEIDPVWGISAEQFAEDLSQIGTPKIEVQINSPGGSVFEGLAIYNALRTHPAHVTTRVDGIAASAASVIAQAGDRRVIVESAQTMIHEAWGIAIGPAAELREFADLLDKQNGVLAGIYASRSDRDVAHFRGLMGTDTYLTDQETIDLGLADEILVPERQTDEPQDRPQPVVAPEDADADDIRTQLTELMSDNDFRQQLGLEPLPPSPSAGEREETPPNGERPEALIDVEQANGLLDALTLDRKANL